MRNVKHLITIVTAAVALIGAASAMAQGAGAPRSSGQFAYGEKGADDEALANFKSTKTRAEVRAEALAARRTGDFVYGERGADYTQLAEFKSTKTRGQVRAETFEARKLGLLDQRGDLSEPATITPAQAEQIRMAGLRALAAEQGRMAAK